MNKVQKKQHIFLIVLLSSIFILVGCTSNVSTKNEQNRPVIKEEVKVNKNNGKALSIKKSKDSIENDDKLSTQVMVKNTSSFNVSNIYIVYNELDKNNNTIVKSKSFIDMTLSPNEVAYIEIMHQKYVTNVDITEYKYAVDNKLVRYDLKKDEVYIKDNNNIEIENSKSYEALAISDVKQINESSEGNAYSVKIKNLLSKDLGNIVLKVAELNDKKEYIRVNHIPFNNLLKPSEEADVNIISSNKAKKLEVVGYVYDNPEEKTKIEIDIKSNQVEISK